MSGKFELDADRFFVFDLFCLDERIFCTTGKESGNALVLPPLTGSEGYPSRFSRSGSLASSVRAKSVQFQRAVSKRGWVVSINEITVAATVARRRISPGKDARRAHFYGESER